MRLHVTPGRRISGEVAVPGDKSIAHRWLLLGATANGQVRIEGLPRSLDVASTVACLARLAPAARPALEAWASRSAVTDERHSSTWNREPSTLEVEELDLPGEGGGAGRAGAPPPPPRRPPPGGGCPPGGAPPPPLFFPAAPEGGRTPSF